MRLVVDASVAVKWLVAEVDSGMAREVVARGDELHAPRLMACEIANAMWRKARLGEIEPGEASDMAVSVRKMPVRWNADETVAGDAVRLALALDRPVYDLRLSGAGLPYRRRPGYRGPPIRECAGAHRTRRRGGDSGGLRGNPGLTFGPSRQSLSVAD